MKIIILIHCPDQKGIISSVTGFIQNHSGNIVYLDQHVDKSANVFFMRLESDFENVDLELLEKNFNTELADKYAMQWSLHTDSKKPKMAIFVSKYNHCLYDLLSRFNSGELPVEIPFILSNHPDLKYVADQFDIPYHYIPFNKENRAECEKKQIALLKEYEVDFIVLARYMQIVSGNLINLYPDKIINIHHSFLPAFAGA